MNFIVPVHWTDSIIRIRIITRRHDPRKQRRNVSPIPMSAIPVDTFESSPAPCRGDDMLDKNISKTSQQQSNAALSRCVAYRVLGCLLSHAIYRPQ